MKTVRVRGYAKVNLYLSVTGQREGFHQLDSLAVTVNVYDSVTVTRRRDKKIIVKFGGRHQPHIEERSNNAYKAAVLFRDTFNTYGVDVVITKRIPIGGGLGGSSADISATLSAMKLLFDVKEDVKPLADALGSDSGYLLTGGYARLEGKGDKVTPLDLNTKLYMVAVPVAGGVRTKDCFSLFDSLNKDHSAAPTFEEVYAALKENTYEKRHFYNALYDAASSLNVGIAHAAEDLRALSPRGLFMTGSGSTVVGIFDTEELCLWAMDKLKRDHPRCFTCQSLTKKEIEDLKGLKNPFILQTE